MCPSVCNPFMLSTIPKEILLDHIATYLLSRERSNIGSVDRTCWGILGLDIPTSSVAISSRLGKFTSWSGTTPHGYTYAQWLGPDLQPAQALDVYGRTAFVVSWKKGGAQRQEMYRLSCWDVALGKSMWVENEGSSLAILEIISKCHHRLCNGVCRECLYHKGCLLIKTAIFLGLKRIVTWVMKQSPDVLSTLDIHSRTCAIQMNQVFSRSDINPTP